MPIENNPNDGLFWRLLLYIGGVLLGLGAKLATINRMKKLTWQDTLFHTAIAFACAFLVGALCWYSGKQEYAIVFSVILGRFGDSIIIAIGKGLKNWLTKNVENNDKYDASQEE